MTKAKATQAAIEMSLCSMGRRSTPSLMPHAESRFQFVGRRISRDLTLKFFLKQALTPNAISGLGGGNESYAEALRIERLGGGA